MTRAATTLLLILVVDDIRDNRQMYAEYLEYDGYHVEQAGSGAKRSCSRRKRPRR